MPVEKIEVGKIYRHKYYYYVTIYGSNDDNIKGFDVISKEDSFILLSQYDYDKQKCKILTKNGTTGWIYVLPEALDRQFDL